MPANGRAGTFFTLAVGNFTQIDLAGPIHLTSEESPMNVDVKNSLTKPKRRVSDLTMTVGLAVLVSLGVMALPLRADAAGDHAIGAATQRGSDSHGVEKDEDTPTCHSIPTASVTASDAPQINILAPTLGRPLVSPLDIEVQFVPATSNAAVRADTFRVCYVGFLTVDITKRPEIVIDLQTGMFDAQSQRLVAGAAPADPDEAAGLIPMGLDAASRIKHLRTSCQSGRNNPVQRDSPVPRDSARRPREYQSAVWD